MKNSIKNKVSTALSLLLAVTFTAPVLATQGSTIEEQITAELQQEMEYLDGNNYLNSSYLDYDIEFHIEDISFDGISDMHTLDYYEEGMLYVDAPVNELNEPNLSTIESFNLALPTFSEVDDNLKINSI